MEMIKFKDPRRSSQEWTVQQTIPAVMSQWGTAAEVYAKVQRNLWQEVLTE